MSKYLPAHPDCYICQEGIQKPMDNGWNKGEGVHIAFGGYGIDCPATKEQYDRWCTAIDDPYSRWEMD